MSGRALTSACNTVSSAATGNTSPVLANWISNGVPSTTGAALNRSKCNAVEPVSLNPYRTVSIIGGGFGLYALGDLVFGLRTAAGNADFGSPFDLFWIAGYGLLVAATWPPDATREPGTGVGGERQPRSCGSRG